jgi:hypothetical protein
VWSIAFTGVSLAFSGEGVSSLAFLLSDSKVMPLRECYATTFCANLCQFLLLPFVN